jgi:hypothetical protein
MRETGADGNGTEMLNHQEVELLRPAPGLI